MLLWTFLDSPCPCAYVSLLSTFLSEEFLNHKLSIQLALAEITSFQKWLYTYVDYVCPLQCRKIAITLHLCRHLVFLSFFLILVILVYVDINHSGSNLCLSNDQGG